METIATNDSTPDFQNMDIEMLLTEGDRRHSPLLKRKCREVQPQFSLDEQRYLMIKQGVRH
jgi:hypothetical protein